MFEVIVKTWQGAVVLGSPPKAAGSWSESSFLPHGPPTILGGSWAGSKELILLHFGLL